MDKILTFIKRQKLIISVTLAVLIALLVWSNVYLDVNTHTVSSAALPDSFDGFRIAHISDLHNAELGNDNSRLIKKLTEASPNIIAITGDSVDYFHTDFECVLVFIEQAVKIAPCYYVTGNHEAWIGAFNLKEFETKLTDLGVTVLHNESIMLERGGEYIYLAGIDDPDCGGDYRKNLENVSDSDCFTVLLSHRPELFEEYVKNGFDLVLSGHAHGGQFRLPLIGGLLAPNQGWFPKYDSGIYSEGSTNMVVSRGIGNSVVPVRINNPSELIIIELKKQ